MGNPIVIKTRLYYVVLLYTYVDGQDVLLESLYYRLNTSRFIVDTIGS